MTDLMTEDKILLEGMVFYGYHGVKEAEKELGQRFVVDLEVRFDLARPGSSDLIEHTINYSALHQTVSDIVTGPSCNLIETLAERVASLVLDRFPAEAVRVRIKKPEVPIPGMLGAAGVEITRSR